MIHDDMICKYDTKAKTKAKAKEKKKNHKLMYKNQNFPS
jgi:hypothetical protein